MLLSVAGTGTESSLRDPPYAPPQSLSFGRVSIPVLHIVVAKPRVCDHDPVAAIGSTWARVLRTRRSMVLEVWTVYGK